MPTTTFQLPAFLADGGTVTFAYPSGTNAATFPTTSGHVLKDRGTKWFSPREFTVVFGASDITVTYQGGETIPKGTVLTLELDGVEDEGDALKVDIGDGAGPVALSAVLGKFSGRQAGFWTDASTGPQPTVHRLADRVFIDDGVQANATWGGTEGSPFAAFARWPERESSLFVHNSRGRVAISGVTMSSLETEETAAGLSQFWPAVAVLGFAVNDRTTDLRNVWGLYSEARREAGCGGAFGIEIDVSNGGSLVTPTPYSAYTGASGATVGLWVASGGSIDGQEDASAAMVVVPNTKKFTKGIVFLATSLTGGDGDATNGGIAIELAKGHRIRWMASGSVQGMIVDSQVTSAQTSPMLLRSTNNAFWIGRGDYAGVKINTIGTDGSNYTTPVISARNGNQNALFSIESSATDAGFEFQRKGAGNFVFNALKSAADDAAAATAGVPVNGLYHNSGAVRVRLT
jgi:hypothetical protein